MQKYFDKLIEEICREQNIKYQYLSKSWIIALEKDNQVKYISGYKFDLNNHALGNILDDKFATYELLKYYDIPVVEHKIIYSSNNKNTYAINCNSIEYVEQYFDLNNKNIVIKPNNSTCGKNVYHIEDRYKIKEILENLFIDNFSLSMCPYYNIKNEYRAIVLNNKCELAYCKYLPIVIGDGKSSLRSLLIKFNNSLAHELTNNKFDKITKHIHRIEITEYSIDENPLEKNFFIFYLLFCNIGPYKSSYHSKEKYHLSSFNRITRK